MNATDPAFPSYPPLTISGSVTACIHPLPGMSIRAYLAAKALPEAIVWQRLTAAGYTVSTDSCARLAVQLADALIAELNRTTP